jgi:hypothetical protein
MRKFLYSKVKPGESTTQIERKLFIQERTPHGKNFNRSCLFPPSNLF